MGATDPWRATRFPALRHNPEAPVLSWRYMQSIMAITLSESAARHVAESLTKRGAGVGVRVGVKSTGCSGFSYQLEYVDEAAPRDVLFEQHGIKILVDRDSLALIDGTELDYVREGLNEGFRFNNPNERDRCGCGESFRV